MRSCLKLYWTPFLYVIVWTLYFAYFWSKALFYSPAGDLVAGHVNIWGDWAVHLTMTSSMTERGLWLVRSPLLITAPFSYPFAADALSAALNQMGVSLINSLVIPSFIFSVLMVVALLAFYQQLLRSTAQAIVATTIFLLNGGIGFYYFFKDIAASATPLLTAINPAHEYTRLDVEGMKWISVIDSMMIPQRAFNLGFPLALIILTIILFVIIAPKAFAGASPSRPTARWSLLIAGILLGMMPILHTHSALALAVILVFWTITDALFSFMTLRNKRRPLIQLTRLLIPWFSIACIALPIGAFWFIKVLGQSGRDFITWHPGWLATDFDMNWFWFWFKNWGITPIIAVIGFFSLLKWGKFAKISAEKKYVAALFLPFFFLFIAANLWLFQPFAWDNTKLIVWASVGFSALATIFLANVWQAAKKLNRQIGWRAVAVFIFIIITLSGAIDAYRILRHGLHSYTMYSVEELKLADWVKTNTSKNAVWLTGDQHNHWLFNLTGRQVIMAYRGWMWTHGYNYYPTEAAVQHMYRFPEESAMIFKNYGVKYVVVGPNEETVWGARRATFDKVLPIVKKTRNYTIYEIYDSVR